MLYLVIELTYHNGFMFLQVTFESLLETMCSLQLIIGVKLASQSLHSKSLQICWQQFSVQ